MKAKTPFGFGLFSPAAPDLIDSPSSAPGPFRAPSLPRSKSQATFRRPTGFVRQKLIGTICIDLKHRIITYFVALKKSKGTVVHSRG